MEKGETPEEAAKKKHLRNWE
ncbi:hypothetical protein ABHM95_07910 [Solibacillus isronensis]